jgi:hypothetical protein
MLRRLAGGRLQKRTQVQWDIGAALGADDGAHVSTSPQAGISFSSNRFLNELHLGKLSETVVVSARACRLNHIPD